MLRLGGRQGESLGVWVYLYLLLLLEPGHVPGPVAPQALLAAEAGEAAGLRLIARGAPSLEACVTFHGTAAPSQRNVRGEAGLAPLAHRRFGLDTVNGQAFGRSTLKLHQ